MDDHSNQPPPPKGSPALALLLGFLPSAILISLFSGMGNIFPKSEQNLLLWLACVFSITCCIVSSSMLFRRGTGGAIGGALLLMLLNGFIAFFFGCCASINF